MTGLESPLVVRADGGLANKLRVLLSYREVARRQATTLVCIWKREAACRARFGDLFEALGGAAILESQAEDYSDVRSALVRWGCDDRSHSIPGAIHTHPVVAGTIREARMYDDLRPRPMLADAVDTMIEACGGAGNFIAVHLRRTDWAELFGISTPDDEFLRYVEACSKRDWTSGGRKAEPLVYVATDNAVTQRALLGSLGGRARVFAPIEDDHSDLRHTSVFHAAVDLFTAAAAGAFKGSRGSSFSEAICLLRKARAATVGVHRDELYSHRQRRRRQWRQQRKEERAAGSSRHAGARLTPDVTLTDRTSG